MKKQKYYVVIKGYSTGVIDNWPECEKAIKGFPNAIFKSYNNPDDANDAFNRGSIEPPDTDPPLDFPSLF